MATTIDTVRKAIEERIFEEFSLEPPTYEVAFQNVPFVPPEGSPWLSVAISFSETTYATLLGAKPGRDLCNGVIVASVFTPSGTGAGLSNTLAQRLKSLFNRQTVDGIIFRGASGPTVVEDGQPSSFFQAQITVPFEAYLD